MFLILKDMFSEFPWCQIFIVTLFAFGMLFWSMFTRGYFETVVNTSDLPFGKLVIAYKYVSDYKAVTLFRGRSPFSLKYKTIIIQYGHNFKLSGVNPAKTYAIGFVLNENGMYPDTLSMRDFIHQGYRLESFPYVNHSIVITVFHKFRWAMPFCTSRIYPRLISYVAERRLCAHPVIEIYDMKNKVMTIVMPLARQHDFYVREAMDKIIYETVYDNGSDESSYDGTNSDDTASDTE